jgi:hypothetical protein
VFNDGVINNPLIHCLLGPKILLVMLHYLEIATDINFTEIIATGFQKME